MSAHHGSLFVLHVLVSSSQAELGLKKAQRGMERQMEGVGHLSCKEYESWLGFFRYQAFWNKGNPLSELMIQGNTNCALPAVVQDLDWGHILEECFFLPHPPASLDIWLCP